MSLIWMIAAALPIGPAVYLLLPFLACHLRPQLVAGFLSLSTAAANSRVAELTGRLLPLGFLAKIAARLQKAGIFDKRAPTAYLCLMIFSVPTMAVLGMLTGNPGSQFLLTGVLTMTLINTWIGHRTKARQKAFTRALYKIYRFLDLQLTAGIKITDSLRGLPEAVQEKTIRPILIRFAALYELTLDLDIAFAEIRAAFSGIDCELLATHLRQCLLTGEAGRSLLRMEELLFSRYFNLLQADTQKIRLHLLLIALLGIIPAVILFMYPLLYQALSAMQSVFG